MASVYGWVRRWREGGAAALAEEVVGHPLPSKLLRGGSLAAIREAESLLAAGEPDMPPLAIAGGIADQMGGIVLAYGVLAMLLTLGWLSPSRTNRSIMSSGAPSPAIVVLIATRRLSPGSNPS